MGKNRLPELAKTQLSDLLNQPGCILYSSHKTLKPGDIYLMGFNPGGAGGKPLSHHIDGMLDYDKNAYIDESWSNLKGESKKGASPLQKRVCWIIQSLGYNPKDVCASNLIFFQSRAAVDIDYSLAETCWPVHEAIIDIVQPKIILTFGNSAISPYGYLKSVYGGEEDVAPSGHGNWMIKGFKTKINGRPVYVAGLPHLSRYSPIGKEDVTHWISGKF
ncbi:hypothetical protein [Oceanimonas smirnovii]|uniref:hypothetical protein n=1 Tax=Oceanimonas smirnovii TaxID=264574 RepID=UPI000476F75B|nr:hypothetical protein [Oceanimonas smirnovii]